MNNKLVYLYEYIDINECSSIKKGCAHAHNCTNTIGSYYCSCNAGYVLSGKSCNGIYILYICPGCIKIIVDINECNVNNGGCEHSCTNTVGSYTCSCNTGYQLSLGHYCSGNLIENYYALLICRY